MKLKVAPAGPGGGTGGGGMGGGEKTGLPKVLVAQAELEPAEIQNLGDIMPQFLDVKAKSKQPISFHIRIEIGNGIDLPSAEITKTINGLLAEVKDGFQVQ